MVMMLNLNAIVILWLYSTINGYCEDTPGATSTPSKPSFPREMLVKEVSYRLETKRSYLKRISGSGDSLKVGTPVEGDFREGKESLIYRCEPCGSERKVDDHLTSIFNITSGNNAGRKEEAVKIWEYFIPIRKEIWKCKDTNDKEAAIFYRVVNELLGTKEIANIEYQDGVEVSVEYHLGALGTARIKEIKYFSDNSDGTSKFLSYKGRLILPIPELLTVDNLILGEPQLSLDENGYFKEIHRYEETEKKIVEVSNAGMNLTLGSHWEETISSTTTSTKANCYEHQRYKPYPSALKTEVLQEIGLGNVPVQARLTDELYSEYILPTTEEFWMCKFGEKDNDVFLRVVNEGCIRRNISNIEYLHSIQIISRIEIDPTTQGAMFREVKYWSPVTGKVLRYDGQLKLIRRRKFNPKDREFEFLLEPNRVYRTFISSNGLDLRIGSESLQEIVPKSKNLRVSCTRKEFSRYPRAFDIQIKIITNVDGKAYSTQDFRKTLPTTQFKILERYVEHCSGASGEEKKVEFLRIRTLLRILCAVHEIESYDGVSIYQPSNKINDIVEIKYLDKNDYSVVRYDGELSTTDIGGQKKNEEAVRKTADEIYWTVRHFARKPSSWKEVTHGPGSLMIKDEGSKVWKFGSDPDPTTQLLGDQNDIAECEATGEEETRSLETKTCCQSSNRYEDFEGKSGQEIVIPSKRNYWRCSISEKGLNFYRVLNIQVVNDIPSLAKRLDYSLGAEAFFEMTSKDQYQLKMNEIKYVGKADDVVKKYEGFIVMKDQEEEIESNEWRSGTVMAPRQTHCTTRTYKRPRLLTQERSYVTQIQKNSGSSITFGSKWVETFGDKNTRMKCEHLKEINEEQFNTFYRTKIRDNGERSYKREEFSSYFQSSAVKLWKVYRCTNEAQNDHSFLRIFTHFSERDPQIKQISHNEEVTIFVGKNDVRGDRIVARIIEIKYLDPVNYQQLKFEGVVELKESEELTSTDMHQTSRKEIYYALQEDEIFRTFVRKVAVFIVEIGTEEGDVFSVAGVTPYSCERKTLSDLGLEESFNSYLQPDFQLYRIKENGMMEHEEKMKSSLFKIDSQLMLCELGKNSFLRVQHTFNENAKDVALVYHYDGVTVSNGNGEGPLTITQVLYLNHTLTQESKQKKILKYDGFLHFVNEPTPPVGNEREERPQNEDPKKYERRNEVVYMAEIVKRKLFEEKLNPIALEVGSPWTREFGTKDDVALCERINHEFNERLATKVRVPERKEESIDKDVFEVVKQKVFECFDKKKQKFWRVVNDLLTRHNVTKVFYLAGIEMDQIKLPDGEDAVQIKEEKYLDPETYEVLKYDGELTVIAKINTRVTKLFQVPIDSDDYPVELELQSPAKKQDSFWPLEVLTLYARSKIDHEFQYAKIQFTNRGIRRKVIEKGFGERFQVGSQWERELTFHPDDGYLICVLDQWNPNNHLKFSTKVILFIDNHQHVLDDETIQNYFKITRIEVWVCANKKETILRVVTKFEGKKPMYSISYTDGVVVENFALSVGGTAHITETKYVDTEDFKTLRYDGEVKLINPLTNPPVKPEIKQKEGLLRDLFNHEELSSNYD